MMKTPMHMKLAEIFLYHVFFRGKQCKQCLQFLSSTQRMLRISRQLLGIHHLKLVKVPKWPTTPKLWFKFEMRPRFVHFHQLDCVFDIHYIYSLQQKYHVRYYLLVVSFPQLVYLQYRRCLLSVISKSMDFGINLLSTTIHPHRSGSISSPFPFHSLIW